MRFRRVGPKAAPRGAADLRPFASPSVSRDEGAPHEAADPENEVSHVRIETERSPDARSPRGGAGRARLLRAQDPGRVLRARGKGGVLRPGARADALRLLSVMTTEAAWNAFHPRLRAFALRQVGSAADAEDIVQKVFLRLHRSLPALRRADRIGAWLFAAVRNAVVDHYRAPARRRERPEGDARDLEAVAGATSEAEPAVSPRAQAARCLRGMMRRLSASDRRALDLVELQGMTQVEVARTEGLSLSGMKARVQRARRRLKAAMEECCRILLDARAGVMECQGKGCSR